MACFKDFSATVLLEHLKTNWTKVGTVLLYMSHMFDLFSGSFKCFVQRQDERVYAEIRWERWWEDWDVRGKFPPFFTTKVDYSHSNGLNTRWEYKADDEGGLGAWRRAEGDIYRGDVGMMKGVAVRWMSGGRDGWGGGRRWGVKSIMMTAQANG